MPTYFETELALRAAQIRQLRKQNAEMLRILKEIHYVIEKEEMICPSCGVLCCSDDCELAEIIALDQVDN